MNRVSVLSYHFYGRYGWDVVIYRGGIKGCVVIDLDDINEQPELNISRLMNEGIHEKDVPENVKSKVREYMSSAFFELDFCKMLNRLENEY